jgi:hypothetical protein
MRLLLHFTALATIVLVLFSCNVEEDLDSFVDHSYYIQLKIDGNRINYEDGILGMQNTAIRSTSEYDSTVLEKQASFFNGDGTLSDGIDISINQFKILPAPDTLQKNIDSLFTVGSYQYKNTLNKEGIEIAIITEGTTWSTSKGIANQDGSNFIVSQHIYKGTQTYRYETSGSFICKVYDGAGNVKLINGTFKLKTNTNITI